MQNIEILSHKTKKDWLKAWEDSVVEDSRENLRKYHSKNCYYGHFKGEDDFVLYYHKEFEGNSLNTYFHGHVEKDPNGCKITGHFAKKRTARIFLIFASFLTAITALVLAYRGQYSMMLAPIVLCAICISCYYVTPKSMQKTLMDGLKKISF